MNPNDLTMVFTNGWAQSEPYVLRHAAGFNEEIMVVLALAILLGSFLVWFFMRSRSRLAEKRLDVVQELVRNGQIGPEQLEDLINPGKRFLRVALVVAWFLLIGGGAMLVVAIAEGWPDRFSELGALGLGAIGLAISTMSAPIMLREFRRQGVI